ncbi:hypothetical protein M9H77_35559 [Catharanthus roseus]|uniref:Uncharacterized protein n=1 Tax=Catharanthus roseus TaxID=4058 RepID=A0ACB9ZQ97_CATRO|nr:hypothetical protein M9H77_35559 [Catharanthus roseus]
MHFGVETTNQAESEHSVLKIWLLTCHGDLDTVFLNIDSLIEGQMVDIKTSLEYSRTKEKFNVKSNPIQKILVDIEAFWKTLEIGSCYPSTRQHDMDFEMCSLIDLLHHINTEFESGSGSSSGSRRRGRPPRGPRGRGRGCSNRWSSLSSVIDPSPCMTFPYTDAFLDFIYTFIFNWKNVISDGNCGFQVVANFMFGDKHQWPEVRRRMLFELEHMANIYVSLLGSAECVYELVRRTQWQNGTAPLDHWLETLDSLYVIANAFNLCVILIARVGSTTVLPLYSYSNHPKGTLVIGLLTEQQHFIQLQMYDGYPIPPLHMQWVYRRGDRVSSWADAYHIGLQIGTRGLQIGMRSLL